LVLSIAKTNQMVLKAMKTALSRLRKRTFGTLEELGMLQITAAHFLHLFD